MKQDMASAPTNSSAEDETLVLGNRKVDKVSYKFLLI